VIKQKTLALSETALFNDKVNAALQGLNSRRQITRVITAGGEEKILTEWEDDIVQRNGAIDRLEGLANERPSEVPRIASMLSVYVRELSSVSDPQTHPRQKYSELVDPISDTVSLSKDEALEQLGVTEDDIENRFEEVADIGCKRTLVISIEVPSLRLLYLVEVGGHIGIERGK
jgi:hypothetical protein